MRTSTQPAPTDDDLRHTARTDGLAHTTANGWTVVRVSGEIDVCSCDPIRETIARLTEQGHRHVVLDLRGVTFLDSMGLGAIVAITKHLRARAGSLRLICTDSRILELFGIGGLREVYAFHASPEEATRYAPEGSGLAGWPHRHP